jgi:hypothetical protein
MKTLIILTVPASAMAAGTVAVSGSSARTKR